MYSIEGELNKVVSIKNILGGCVPVNMGNVDFIKIYTHLLELGLVKVVGEEITFIPDNDILKHTSITRNIYNVYCMRSCIENQIRLKLAAYNYNSLDEVFRYMVRYPDDKEASVLYNWGEDCELITDKVISGDVIYVDDADTLNNLPKFPFDK